MPGDEVIVFEPRVRQLHPGDPAGRRHAGAAAVDRSRLRHRLAAVRRAVTPRTRMIVVNTPNNPGTGDRCRRRTSRPIAEVTRGTAIVIVSDEVYEHMVYDGARTRASRAATSSRCAASSSARSARRSMPPAGKSATRWRRRRSPRKSGACTNSRCSPSTAPVQHGLAAFLRASRRATRRCRRSSKRKRDLLRSALADTPLDLLPCRGSYFQLATYGRISDEPAAAFAQRLVREVGVATIPLSAFYQDGTDHHVIRFCFAKRDETLREAAERLRRVNASA